MIANNIKGMTEEKKERKLQILRDSRTGKYLNVTTRFDNEIAHALSDIEDSFINMQDKISSAYGSESFLSKVSSEFCNEIYGKLKQFYILARQVEDDKKVDERAKEEARAESARRAAEEVHRRKENLFRL